MLGLMVGQLCLGFLAFITRVMWGRDAAQPELPMVISTVVHVAVGALLLATTVVLAIQVWRHVPVLSKSAFRAGPERLSASIGRDMESVSRRSDERWLRDDNRTIPA